MSETVLADTSYWIALFDEREPRHSDLSGTEQLIETLTLVVPWPILYETLRTRFVRRRDWVARLDHRLKRANVAFVDDREFCEQAYAMAVDSSTRMNRPISMVDMLCRLLITDPNVHIDYLLTTNAADFHDVCRSHRVEMLL